MNSPYNKGVLALLTAIANLLILFGIDLPKDYTAYLSSAATIIGAVLVYWVANKNFVRIDN